MCPWGCVEAPDEARPGCGLGQGREQVPVLSTGLLVAQASPAALAGTKSTLHKIHPLEGSILPRVAKAPNSAPPQQWLSQQWAVFGAADSSASVDLSRLLQGHFGETPTKVWTSLPPPVASNTQSQLGLWWVYAFPKGNGGRGGIAGGASRDIWKFSCATCLKDLLSICLSQIWDVFGKCDGRFSSALAFSALPRSLTVIKNQSRGICTLLLLSHLQPETRSLMENYLQRRETELSPVRKRSPVLTHVGPHIECGFVSATQHFLEQQTSQPKILATQAHPAMSWESRSPNTVAHGSRYLFNDCAVSPPRELRPAQKVALRKNFL